MKSSIKYTDILKEEKRILAQMEASYDRLVMEGSMHPFTATHRKECHRILVKMLEKCEPGRQMNFFELFQSTNK